MKWINYLKYFFYISSNWNIQLSLFVMYHEIKGEKKYGIHTTGFDELQALKKGGTDISHSTLYMPVSYYVLEKIFGQPSFSFKKHFTDIGCGKGRALCVAAINGFPKVTGIDFSETLCNEAILNLNAIKQHIVTLNYSVVYKNAVDFNIPADADHLFFFNPFDGIIMKQVIDNINKSLQQNPRHITVIYVNPLHKELFITKGFKETYHFRKMKYLEFSILTFGKS